jgi:ATP-dependent helicase/nuclease subunit B
MDEFEEEALADEAVDTALAAGGPAVAYARLAGGPGFRRAVRGAITALRLAGVPPDHLPRGAFQDAAKRDLMHRSLTAVEEMMASRHATDVAGVLDLATRALAEGEPIPADHVYLLPGLSTRGASGRFVSALRDRGAEVLPTDPVAGLETPRGFLWRETETPTSLSFLATPDRTVPRGEPRSGDMEGLPLFEAVSPPGAAGPEKEVGIDLFHAAGVHEELREVLRRVTASGARLDEVEIVTPDPETYGPALQALASRLGIEVTFAVGLPVARTRPGRAMVAYLRWVGDDFPSSALRRLLETGDLQAPGRHRRISPPRLARRLRRLRIGWGRERYAASIGAAIRRLDRRPSDPRPGEAPEVEERRRDRERRELEALRALVRHLLRHTPPEVPKRLELHPRPVAPAALAEGLATFLRLVPTARGSVDETAKERMLRILDRVRGTLTRRVAFGSAIGTLEDHLDIRVPAPRAEGKAPWLSDGGSLHLSDLEHGGLTARRMTFLVGMDAARFPGGDLQDPLLLDRERIRLSEELPTSAQRLEDRQFALAALLARLRGDVTLSHAAWDSGEARALTPSPVLLQAFRLASGNAAAGFSDLRRHLGTPVSRIPRGGSSIDREDVWLGTLVRGDHFVEGVDAVRASHPRLAEGLDARRAWVDGRPGPHHGLLPPRARFDPRKSPETVLSASRLEVLASCPLRYLYRYVLRIEPLDDPGYEPNLWLDPLARGKLLHTVYESLLRIARERRIEPADEAFEALGRSILEREAERLTEEIPPPGEGVYARELAALAADIRCFVEHVRHRPAPWEAVELAFGLGGEPPVTLELAEGAVRLRGAVDRVDRADPDGSALRIVDYKTGVAGARWAPSTGVFNGGRRLQHLLYTLAVEALEGRPVEAMEYHFPTRRGEGTVHRFGRGELDGGEALIVSLLDAARQGRFLPTEAPGDCRFCDYRTVCRVEGDSWRVPHSPPAAWGKARLEEGADVYAELRRVRGFED